MFFACSDADIISVSSIDNEDVCYNIVCFDSFDEYNDAVKASLHRTLDEQIEWEESMGFRSLGSLSDEIYSAKDTARFTSFEDIVQFAEDNSDYVTLSKDEDGEYSLDQKYEMIAERYIMNEDCMYQVGTQVYKIFSDGKVYADISKVDYLRAINSIQDVAQFSDTALKVINNEIEVTSLKSSSECSDEHQNTATSGNNRTVLVVELQKNTSNLYQSQVYYKVKPQKRTLGVWLNCSRTLSCNITAHVLIYDENTIYNESADIKEIRSNEYATYLDGHLTVRDYMSGSTGFNSYNGVKFTYIYATATSPSTGNAVISCGYE